LTTPSTSLPPKVMLEAEPEPLELDLERTCVLIVDMQNAFLAKGGLIDLKGFDVTPRRAPIRPIQALRRAARAKGCKVIYMAIVHYLEDNGAGPDSVYWHKEGSLAFYRDHPEFEAKLLLPNTWGASIIEELKPAADEIVIEKPRQSGFFDTPLDAVLKRHKIKYLITTGVSTNNCVEATIRDAYSLGYFAILVSDATAASGPPFMQEASIFNVKHAYGWITSSANVMKIMA
jgi:ureidoacrylate peracid hydrolase